MSDFTLVTPTVSFSHVQIYSKTPLCPISEYKAIESHLNDFAASLSSLGALPSSRTGQSLSVSVGRSLRPGVSCPGLPPVDAHGVPVDPYVSTDRDVVKQLQVGMGFRVVATHEGKGTASVALASEDLDGVQFVVTALKGEGGEEEKEEEEPYKHFGAEKLRQFFASHKDRPGIAVLAFTATVSSLPSIYANYKAKHPSLLPYYGADAADARDLRTYVDGADGSVTSTLEVYAYYQGDKGRSPPDRGTVLRFVARDKPCRLPLPGLTASEHRFDGSSAAAYCDHWVSNVVSRTGFLDTLEDCLGFTPKVDFNAGVVAAGEAQIESTVTGNSPPPIAAGGVGLESKALKDQSQVYLPINNALSPVGHVHGFIKEIGQGVQHVASRVGDLLWFIQRANDYRDVFGEGFTFLNIPRSYYGVLTAKMFEREVPDAKEIDGAKATPTAALLNEEDARRAYELCLADAAVCETDGTGAVRLDAPRSTILACLSAGSFGDDATVAKMADVVERSRFANLFSLLRGHISEKDYVTIVRNKILVDVQGEDLLFQIFTSNILQKKAGDESPFLEFIQRVCSQCLGPDGCPAKVKPGCGGFGIRNFLTLFLSIEVSKAMKDCTDARLAGDEERQRIAASRVTAFTEQLDESNPILTDISDAMTAEGRLTELVEAERGSKAPDMSKIEQWTKEKEAFMRAKEQGNERLMACSMKYKDVMKGLREQMAAVVTKATEGGGYL